MEKQVGRDPGNIEQAALTFESKEDALSYLRERLVAEIGNYRQRINLLENQVIKRPRNIFERIKQVGNSPIKNRKKVIERYGKEIAYRKTVIDSINKGEDREVASYLVSQINAMMKAMEESYSLEGVGVRRARENIIILSKINSEQADKFQKQLDEDIKMSGRL